MANEPKPNSKTTKKLVDEVRPNTIPIIPPGTILWTFLVKISSRETLVRHVFINSLNY
jgi:hypothetical protein